MKVNVTAQHYEINEDLLKYITKKLSKLQRYIPRHARASAHADVHLIEHPANSTNPFSCEVILRLPHGEIVAKEDTIHMFAAVDIVEAKVKNQLLKYKYKNDDHDSRRVRLWRQLKLGRRG